MMNRVHKRVRAICESDRVFRPRDWTQRLAGKMASFGRDKRLQFSPLLTPSTLDGRSCVCLHRQLPRKHPVLYEELVDFARRNQLQMLSA